MRPRIRIALFVDYVESEYSQKIIDGATRYIEEHEAELIVFQTGGLSNLEFSYDYQYLAVASHISLQNIDGIIFMTTQELTYFTHEFVYSYIKSFASIPLVSIGFVDDTIPCVLADSRASMKRMVSHLITKHNRRNFALLTAGKDSEEAKEREKAFLDALNENGVPFDNAKRIFGGFLHSTAYSALKNYKIKHGAFDFDAIVALNDEMAYACLDLFAQENIKVPEDIIVTGFDDQMRSLLGNPTLTTINQSIEQQSSEAARLVLDLINGKQCPAKTVITAKEFYRQSCGCIQKDEGFFKEFDENGKLLDTKPPMNNFGFAEWNIKRSQFIQVIKLYSDMQVDMTLEDFRTHINTDLASLGIDAAAVVLFNAPIKTEKFEYFILPSTVRLFCSYDKHTDFYLGKSSTPISFNPRKGIVPPGIFESMHNMYVMSLFRNAVLFGYIVFRPGNYDIAVYTMVMKMLSSNLATAYATTESAHEMHRLTDKYNIAHAISVTDELTGLLNRRGFISLGQKTLEISSAIPSNGMVLFGDLDGLKKINDTYGHAAGDIAITAEASLLKQAFRSSDIIGRMGGDEFAIIALGLTELKYQEIRKKLDESCVAWTATSGQPFTLSMSLGKADFPGKTGENYNIKLLLEEADNALYEEKKIKHSKH